MNFLEAAFREMFGKGSPPGDLHFAGRVRVGRFGGPTAAKLRFVALGTHDHFAASKASVFNRNEGKIDSVVIRFADITGRKRRPNPNRQETLPLCVWIYGGRLNGTAISQLRRIIKQSPTR
jgi:hypothetical protein